MPSVIHDEDDLTDLPEVPRATENGDTQAPYGISQHRSIVGEEGRRMGVWGLPPTKVFQSYAL